MSSIAVIYLGGGKPWGITEKMKSRAGSAIIIVNLMAELPLTMAAGVDRYGGI
jgi:hypothetical protein